MEASRRQLGFRPKVLARALWLPYLYAALGMVVLVWVMSSVLVPLRDLGSQLRFSAAVLQLVGLGVVIRGLWVKGTLFGRPNPAEALRQFGSQLVVAFTRPRTVEITMESSTSVSESLAPIVQAGRKPDTLEEQVRLLREKVDVLTTRLEKGLKKTNERLTEVEMSTNERDTQTRKRMNDLDEKLEKSVAGSYTLEWVAVFWLVIGMAQRVLAEVVV